MSTLWVTQKIEAAKSPRLKAFASLLTVEWAIVVLSLIVRCVGVGRYDLGTDEGHSFLTATSARGLFVELQGDTNPPLYFLLLKGWITLFGSSLVAMRMLSVLFGTATVLLVGKLVKRCGDSARAAAWAMALAAFVPVQIHYAQLARGYTLGCLLMVLGMWTFMRALQLGTRGPWLLHAAVIALGAYTHNLLVPIAFGYVIAAAIMQVGWKTFRTMCWTYAAAGLLALPGILLTLHQEKTSGGMAWLKDYWLRTPPALAIPKSLALLGLGGDMPRYLLTLPAALWAQMLGLALMALSLGAVFWPKRKTVSPGENKQTGIHQGKWFLAVFVVWPLGFIWLYSILRTPIYLVGRYDLFAQPAYLGLLGVGFARLQNMRGARLVLPGLVAVILAVELSFRWAFPLDAQIFHHEARVRVLAPLMTAGDGVVCTGLEASPTMYRLHERGLANQVTTFPSETLGHVGWYINDDEIVRRASEWGEDAKNVLATAGAHGRIWVLLDGAAWDMNPDFIPSPRQQLSLLLLDAARGQGWRVQDMGPDVEGLRMICLERASPSTAPQDNARAGL